MKTNRHIVAFVAAAALSLTACGPGDATTSPTPSLTPTPSATPTETETPTPTPTETATPTPTAVADDCPAWVDDPDNALAAIDFDRYAGICVGMSFPEAEAAAGVPVSGEASCPWFATISSDEELGWYVSALSPSQDPGSEIWFFRMMWLNDPVLANNFDLPRTPEGITIGSTEAEFVAAYPGAVTMLIDDISRGPRDERLVAGPDGLTYVFDVNDGYVTELTWGKRLTGGQNGELCAL